MTIAVVETARPRALGRDELKSTQLQQCGIEKLDDLDKSPTTP